MHRVFSWQQTTTGHVDPRHVTRAIVNLLLDFGYAPGMDYSLDDYVHPHEFGITFIVQSKDSEVCTVLQQEFHMPL